MYSFNRLRHNPVLGEWHSLGWSGKWLNFVRVMSYSREGLVPAAAELPRLVYSFLSVLLVKPGPTRHRPMANPIVFRYLSYSTTFAENAVHCLRRCPAFGQAWTCLFSSVQLDGESASDLPTGWPHDHGSTTSGHGKNPMHLLVKLRSQLRDIYHLIALF